MKNGWAILLLATAWASSYGVGSNNNQEEPFTDVSAPADPSRIGECTQAGRKSLYRILGIEKGGKWMVNILKEKGNYKLATLEGNSSGYTIIPGSQLVLSNCNKGIACLENNQEIHYRFDQEQRQQVEEYLGHSINWFN